MGKRLIIIGFIICIGLAIYAYSKRDKGSLRQSIDTGSKREPRLVLEEFTVYRYRNGDELEGQLSARLGQVFEPNIVELDGEIRGEKRKNGEAQTFEAETATMFFDAKSLNKMMEGTQLVKADLNGFIEVGLKDHLLSTDYALYTAATDVLSSKRPVRVDGHNQVLTAEDGFVYSITKETLSLLGLVKGTFLPNEK